MVHRFGHNLDPLPCVIHPSSILLSISLLPLWPRLFSFAIVIHIWIFFAFASRMRNTHIFESNRNHNETACSFVADLVFCCRGAGSDLPRMPSVWVYPFWGDRFSSILFLGRVLSINSVSGGVALFSTQAVARFGPFPGPPIFPNSVPRPVSFFHFCFCPAHTA